MALRKFVRSIATGPITLYRVLISPWLGSNCRFQPTCSAYSLEAIERHGIVKGYLLGIKRLFKCHPFCQRDFHDPVPEAFDWRAVLGYKSQIQRDKNTKSS